MKTRTKEIFIALAIGVCGVLTSTTSIWFENKINDLESSISDIDNALEWYERYDFRAVSYQTEFESRLRTFKIDTIGETKEQQQFLADKINTKAKLYTRNLINANECFEPNRRIENFDFGGELNDSTMRELNKFTVPLISQTMKHEKDFKRHKDSLNKKLEKKRLYRSFWQWIFNGLIIVLSAWEAILLLGYKKYDQAREQSKSE